VTAGTTHRPTDRNALLAASLLHDLARPVPVLDARRVALVAAHPDDETIGLGAQLRRLSGLRFVHVTDGAPADMRDARTHGFARREDYAAARRVELEAAMARAGIPPARLTGLGVADQEAVQVMAGLARRLADMMDDGNIGVVFTHAFEGGHPDHDATCFAVHAACALLHHHRRRLAPVILEMTGYHAGADGDLDHGTFLAHPGAGPETVLVLDEAARRHKRYLLDCFTSQQAVLVPFRPEVERLRPAPAYDFLRPPHPGTVWYDRFDWGTTARSWRLRAAEAILSLELEAPPWP